MRPQSIFAFFSSICALVILLFAHSAAAVSIGDISNLYVFGDSIVDAGNTQNALGGAIFTPCALNGFTPPCDATPASFGYFDGRFTNGPNAADVVNQAIDGFNSVATSEGGRNYSFGGARAVGGGLPDITLQVGTYLSDVAGTADANALYVINIGGNDVRDQIQATNAGTATLTNQQVIDGVVAAVSSRVSALQAAGAVHILVNGVGDVGNIPESIALGAAVQADGRTLSIDMTAQVFAALDASVFTLDVVALFDDVLLDPTFYGLPAGIDLTGSCLTTGSPPACSNFAFFDTVHPTAALSGILANGMIAAIPEPGTALLLGFGLIGLARRREAA